VPGLYQLLADGGIPLHIGRKRQLIEMHRRFVGLGALDGDPPLDL
jgi:hypothetical protein